MADDLRKRIARRLGEAWPDLAEDPVYLDQLAAQTVSVRDHELERLRASLDRVIQGRTEAQLARNVQRLRAERAEAEVQRLADFGVKERERHAAELAKARARLEGAEIELANWRLARSKLSRWWEWPLVQWWWYRQYKRADRRALRRECAELRAREGDR
ncbi:hypothetical protein NE236_41480 [Actinoallomurus purpureus]|uniref:hypothetical protein n=1 Tax=Actinoallomurus purpureus TaxID=478114 RepID=UPI002092CB51|nr:hypothetical protein [Actinoallomurus purpureus]MCO6011441.1 hypothetical protein [Actinoallomurus purpureus]